MICKVCNQEIPAERVEALQEMGIYPNTCVLHSETKPKMVVMEYGHKTAGAIVVVGNDPEQQRLAQRAYRRSR